MKPSRSKGKPVHPSKTAKEDRGQSADAEAEVALTSEERARLLAELEAEFAAAERSIEEEGTISAEEFLKQRAAYWSGLTQSSNEKDERSPRRQRR